MKQQNSISKNIIKFIKRDIYHTLALWVFVEPFPVILGLVLHLKALQLQKLKTAESIVVVKVLASPASSVRCFAGDYVAKPTSFTPNAIAEIEKLIVSIPAPSTTIITGTAPCGNNILGSVVSKTSSANTSFAGAKALFNFKI